MSGLADRKMLVEIGNGQAFVVPINPVARTSNLYPSLDDTQYDAVVNGRYLQSPFSNASGDCLSFTLTDGLVGFQDDKLPPAERKIRTSRGVPTNQPHHIHDRKYVYLRSCM
ncbi:MAG: hypothetical protein ACRDQY_05130 [Pseudonocardiaceae bacterium]